MSFTPPSLVVYEEVTCEIPGLLEPSYRFLRIIEFDYELMNAIYYPASYFINYDRSLVLEEIRERGRRMELSMRYRDLPNLFYPQSGNEKDYRNSKNLRSALGTLKSKLRDADERNRKLLELKKQQLDKAKKRFERLSKKDSYVPHSGEDTNEFESFVSNMDKLSGMYDNDTGVFDVFVRHCEGIALLFAALSDSHSTRQVIAIVALWLRDFVPQSMITSLSTYISGLLSYTPQAGLDIDTFRLAMRSWRDVVSLPAFRHISSILSLSVAAGLCRACDVNLEIGNLKIFSVKVLERQANAIDFLDAILASADYFVEAGYEAFRTKSWRPFLFDDQHARLLEEDYFKIARAMKLVNQGNLELLESDFSENELSALIDDTTRGYQDCARNSKHNYQSKIIQERYNQLQLWKIELLQTTMGGGLREAPFSIFVIGPSGIGKSAIINNLMQLVLQSNNFSHDQRRVVTLNPEDKFWSNYRSDTTGVLLDDVANSSPKFVQNNPCRTIIDLNNNIAGYAPKAEAHEKGKVAVRPRVLGVTSNVKDLNARIYSENPLSICRRGYTITPKLKPQFSTRGQFDIDKVKAVFGEEIPIYPDIYDFDVELPVEVRGSYKDLEYKPIMFDDIEMKNVSYRTLIIWIIITSKKHFRDQKETIRVLSKQHRKIEFDEKGFPIELGLVHQSGFELLSFFLTSKFSQYWIRGKEHFSLFDEWVEKTSVSTLSSSLEFIENSWCTWWFRLIPQEIWDNKHLNDYFMGYAYICLRGNVRTWTVLYYLGLFHAMCVALTEDVIIGLLWAIMYWLIFSGVIACAKRRTIRRIATMRDAIPLTFKHFRDNQLQYAIYGITALYAARCMYKVYKVFRALPEPQGNLNPENEAEITKRDSETNVWKKVSISKLPCSAKSKCITLDGLSSLVKKNLAYMRTPDGQFCNAFFIKSNIALFPSHMLKDDVQLYEFYRDSPDLLGTQFKAKLHPSDVFHLPNTDLVAAIIPSAGDWKDLSDYFTIDPHTTTPFQMVWQARDGTHRDFYGVAHYSDRLSNGICVFTGYKYELNADTFTGLCMAPLISQTKSPQIIGFHLGGKNGTPQGIAGHFSTGMLSEMDEFFSFRMSKFVSASSGTIPEQQFGITYFNGPEIHKKSPVNFMPETGNMLVYGSCIGRTSMKSDVVRTPIADTITELTGFKKEFCGPKFHPWKPWQANLEYSSNPHSGVDPLLLERACRDYYDALKPKFEMLSHSVVPLTDVESVSGIDGKRFIDAMPASTSLGYPLNKAKSDILIDLEPTDDHSCPRTFPSFIWDEVAKACDCYRRGERYYPIFKGCLKDEPTPEEKEKVRVFQAAAIVGQILTRKYYLPICRVLALFPILAECAVGINPMSDEWHQLQAWFTKYGRDYILAGDYSKYDVTMPAELTTAAFTLLMKFAELCGYSDDDLLIMRGIATDIIYPLMAYHGNLIQLYGSNPSGQNLTVFINSIVNSLLLRMGFFYTYPQCEIAFRDAVAVATLGDDFKGSVKEGYRDFNHLSYRDYLTTMGMTITMPDKTSDPIPFMKDEDADFLKRTNYFHPDLKIYVGKLDPESIYKSLKSVCKSSSVTIEEQCASNLDGALVEFFYHGPEEFNKFLEIARITSERHNIAHMVKTLDVSYDERLLKWQEEHNAIVPGRQ